MKPENTFIRSVHRHIPEVYAEKMCNPYRAGTADVWYSGALGDLWVEYKWLPATPVRAVIKPDLSAQQRRWLDSRCAEGRNVAVIVGCPDGGVRFLRGAWSAGVTATRFRAELLDRRALADWIFASVGASPCLSPVTSSMLQKLSPRRTESSSRRS